MGELIAPRPARAGLPSALALALLLVAPTAWGADWAWQEAPVDEPLLLHLDSFPDAIGTDTEIETALSQAVRTWNVEGDAAVALAYGGTTPDLSFEGTDDDLQVVDAAADPQAEGVVATDLVADGEDLLDCDLRILTENADGVVAWTADPEGAVDGEYDLERGLLHLVGLCLGLPESGASGAIMHPELPTATGPDDRHLTDDDVLALQDLYGAAQVQLENWTHAVLYDIEDPDGDGRGAPGEQVFLRVQVINEGDPAYDTVAELSVVSSEADLTLDQATAEGGDIPSGDFGVYEFLLTIDDCAPDANPTTMQLFIGDARGDEHVVNVSFPIQCAVPEGADDEPDGCGCASAPAGHPWLLGPLLLLLARRRS